jgi:hypothetical protein
LRLPSGADYLRAFDTQQVQALAYTFVGVHDASLVAFVIPVYFAPIFIFEGGRGRARPSFELAVIGLRRGLACAG